eukprot:TRINITY_DN23106_c0_g1_i2.p1 TRINITY_DN23106_c0_g1~~TRINITY_DN23106_c0_g1_i2.p1  ORF type:complete len:533 (-),score=100.00 TRINITY_DN23106_c0_g1_i2:57-1655(-)
MADKVLLLLEEARIAHVAETKSLQHQINDLRAKLQGRHDDDDVTVACMDAMDGDDADNAQPDGGDKDQTIDTDRVSLEQTQSHEVQVKRKSGASILMGTRSSSGLVDDGSWVTQIKIFVCGPIFETFFACLIFANAVVMAFEAQYTSFDTQVLLRLDVNNSMSVWPMATPAFAFIGMFFGILFALEVTLKLFVMRLTFFHDIWNWIDAAIVLIWIAGELQDDVVPINGQLFRLFRLARLVRLLRLVRTIQSFDSLYLMTTALKGSLSILTWAAALLFVLQMLFALLFTQLLTELYLNDENVDIEKRQAVYKYFGSFSRSFLSMFELTLANWPPICRLLVENVGEWLLVFSILHKLIIGFAAVGVINGVFMQETFKVASSDDRIMLRAKEKSGKLHAQKMRMLFDAVDVEQRGYISFAQFKLVMSDPHVRTWLASMELSTDDIEKLYSLLDDGDEQLDAEELIKGVAKLKGPARSIDLAILQQELQRFEEVVEDRFQKQMQHEKRPQDAANLMQLRLETTGEESRESRDRYLV